VSNGSAVAQFCRQLRYEFSDPQLLKTALTHRSAGGINNERLEFLGDAIIGFLIADELFTSFPRTDEGQLTRLRSSLVKRDTLARVARRIDLGSVLVLGEGELKSGGWKRDSILANAFEALMGAIYLDSDLEQCRACIHALFEDEFARTSPATVAKDPKTRLQEYLQQRQLALPEYETVQVDGAPHDQRFTVCCKIVAPGAEAMTASGTSRRRAEQAAAEKMLAQLESAQGSAE